jgi:hypothetical protein
MEKIDLEELREGFKAYLGLAPDAVLRPRIRARPEWKRYLDECIPDINEVKTIIAYHGTTSALKDSIARNGLVPRKDNPQRKSTSILTGNPESQRDLVYFTTRTIALMEYALAVEIYGGRPMVVKAVLDADNVFPDEDADGAKNWKESFYETNTIAHRGVVASSNLEFEITRVDSNFKHLIEDTEGN